MFQYPLQSSLRSLAARLSQVEVLIADPDVEISHLVRDVLRYIGFEKMQFARTPEKALEILAAQNIDLMITDWQIMPEQRMSLVQYLRNHDDSPNPYLPVIMLTGRAEKHDVELARDQGVTEFLVKPFTAKRLFERLVMVIENPRSFIISNQYRGPDRRRRTDIPPSGSDRRNFSPYEE